MKKLPQILSTLFTVVLFFFNPFITFIGADWPTYQSNALHTGSDPNETSLTTPLTLHWSLSQITNAQIVENGGIVYAKGSNGILYSIDANTGNINWQVQTQGGEIGYGNNTVYSSNGTASLDAYNASNGQHLWNNSNGVWGLTVSGNVVYTNNGSSVHAIDGSTGNTLWGNGIGSAQANPAISNGMVLEGTYQGPIYGLNATTGATVWTSGATNGNYTGAPLVQGSTVYVGNRSGGWLDAYDVASGNPIWVYHTRTNGNVNDPIVYYNNKFYTMDDTGTVYAFDSTSGQVAWTYSTGSGDNSTPVVAANGIVYVGSTGNNLVGLNAQSGAVLWQYNTGPVSRIIIANHSVIASSSNGLFAFYNPPPVSISASPASGNMTVGSPFTVDVKVNGGGTAFNAAQATVTVSSNVSITGIKSPSTNSCNFDFTKNPTTSNPSFAGGIYGTSSTGCTAYTLVLTPNSPGTGTVTFTNASVKAYADNSELSPIVNNGSFTINAAPTPTGAALQTIDDSVQGTGQNQWNYNGSGWGHCTSCNETNPTVTFYNASQSWDNVTNDYVTIKFTGVQFSLYGATDTRDGFGAISIDGGAETNVDFYSATRTGNVLLWTSPILSNSTHTLKLRVTGTHDSNATDNYIILDRGDILATTTLPNLTVDTYPTDTYNSTLTITGTKDSSITTVYINGSSSNVTYPTSTTWQAQISLPQLGNNNYIIYGKDASNNQTASLSINIDKHTLGDINGDGNVDLIDASLFAVDFGKTSNLIYPLSDMNGDGNVDLTDLSILAKLEQ